MDYDDNPIFDLSVSYVSFLIIFLTISNQLSLVISLTIFEAVKELYKIQFTISIYNSIGNNKIRIIDFDSRTNLNFLFVGQQVVKNTCQCLSTMQVQPRSSIIFPKPTFILSSHCQQVSTGRGRKFQKLFIILLYFGEIE